MSYAEAVLQERGVSAESMRGVVGKPARAIVAAAHKYAADLIVLGQAGAVQRRFGYGLAATVSRRAHCDVLVVR